MAHRFSGITDEEVPRALSVVKANSIEELYARVVPEEHQWDGIMEWLGQAMAEIDIEFLIKAYSKENFDVPPENMFLGGGHYQREIPKAVFENILTGKWYTPYTPYQAEAAQGILVSLFEYQNFIQEMSGMAIANAGLYHGMNALVEGALMACRITGRDKILYSESLHPLAIRNLKTAFGPKIKQGFELLEIPATNGVTRPESIDELVDEKTAAVIVQTPTNFYGLIDGMHGHANSIHSKGALYVAYGGGDQISLAMLTPPGEYGADIYAGEGQHFGIPIGFGGPHIGTLALSKNVLNEKTVRQLPGRLVLPVVDMFGIKAFRLGLQPREQHINREKATSNTCTSGTLIAILSNVWFAMKGSQGIKDAAYQSYQIAHYIVDEILKMPGYETLHNGFFFNEAAIRTPVPAKIIVDSLAERSIFAGIPLSHKFPYAVKSDGRPLYDDNTLLIAATEMNNKPFGNENIDSLLGGLREYAIAH
ncbi:MAG: aminomethyl-transferring glycine dehydrogenase subunit GcvPA [Nanoarchaeota archaeon]|nr:MAG: aminomethyl-transferring glycine dehydrogenase subunit GcvPA [Nanoarchaeota archaeon]